LATLVLSFSIGGMAEMVLTAKTLGANAAMVAAFQVTRAFLVNLCAGPLWTVLSKRSLFNPDKKG
ncbi:MAG: AbrB family transcriptional regulator, partial [Rhodospirillaceae bacterium]